MPWFKVDDSFYDHPKVFDASDCTVALWTRSGSWSARNLTDGFVPSGMIERFCSDPDTAVRELVGRGLWKRTKGGYQFHDWQEFQPAAERVKADRKASAERQKRWREARRNGNRNGVTHASTPPVSNAVTNAAPTRPDPTRSYRDLVKGGYVGNARDSPPPRKCSKHIHDDDPPPCGGCADARREHDAWQADAAEQAEADRLADIVRVRACPHCDADGWAYEPGTRRPQTPYVRCDHEESP